MTEPIVDVHTVAVASAPGDPRGDRSRQAQIGLLLGAEMLGATVYEIDPGQSAGPYSYEYGNEAWLLVLDGQPTLRDPERRARARSWGRRLLPPGTGGRARGP